MALLWLTLLVAQGAALAQTRPSNGSVASADPAASGTALPRVDELRKQLDAIPQKISEADDGRGWLSDINAIGKAADQLATRRTEELADLDSRLAGLGPAPGAGAPADARDVAEQRKALAKERSTVDSELKLARLISVDAEQRGTDLVQQRRAQFQAALTTRTDSPLGGTFWRNLSAALPGDVARLQTLVRQVQKAADKALAPSHRATFFGSLVAALLVAVMGTWLIELLLVKWGRSKLPAGRLRRSLLAAVSVLAHALLVGAAVQIAWNGLAIQGELPDALNVLENATVRLSVFAAFVVGLGHALILRKRSSWRLTHLSDDAARRLSPFAWCFALVSALGGLVMEINIIVGASLAAEVSLNAFMALLTAAMVMASLRRLRAPTASEDAAPDTAQPPRPLWMVLLIAGAGTAAAACVVLVALGFIALAGTLARQLVWCGVVFATTYLLVHLVDDLCDAFLSSKGVLGSRVHNSLGLDAPWLDQASVLVSGAMRLVLFFYMVVALLAPFGTGPDEVFRRGGSLDHSLKIGDLTLAPQALLTALAVVCVGFLRIRMVKRWLSERYFPHTTLEPGMRSSIATLLGYVGGVVVNAVALAGLGISVERIAWVASALSVGIVFGLHAIVQNFISGLILLAERPVKVGDWVKLGDTEGDVRRVNVRATEIQLGDRSTVIVPNSEFITKAVRNMTQAGAQGRVLLQLPAPLHTDARLMRELLLQALREHPGVLETPAPSVSLEGIQNGTLLFQVIGYVDSPRSVSGVRSDLLFSILESLRAAGLSLSPPATTSVPFPDTTPPAG